MKFIASTAGKAATLLSNAHYTQDSRLLRLYTPLGEDKLLAERLSGRESIDGGGFLLLLDVLSDDAHIPLKSLLGKAVRLDIQTASGLPRLWHGHVTGFALLASNGGFARYRLRIEPWLAFLRSRQDSFLFQEQSVITIADSLFADYQGAGGVHAEWRWALADSAVYPKRGTTTQFRESDFAFLSRLLAEEGLCYWFEHQAADGDELGQHTLVLADTVTAHKPGAQTHIAFQRADVTEPHDSLQRWHEQVKLQTSSLVRSSWDYRSVDPRPLQASALHLGNGVQPLVWTDDSGVYSWATRAQGERLLANAAQALTARARSWQAQSTVRTLAPASSFVLDDHFAHAFESEDERRFLVLDIAHSARNNFDEDLGRAVDKALGASSLDKAAGEKQSAKQGTNKGTKQDAEVPFYRNSFTAIRAAVPYKPLTRDGHGMLLHPKPTVHGSQTAIVVGAQGEPVHSDRDHRIKIQFHWQRGSNASARGQTHPSGADNAPASEALGAWVRVASAIAGDNWGYVGLPRAGQEVLVDFIGGDIDRPVVVGALYNGEGESDSQANRQQVGAAAATGNAPPWFAGDSGEHAHAAVYSGIKTQELKTSQDGSSAGTGYNQLVFDGTPGQERAGLATTQAASRLHLGAHRQQADNQRGAGRGHGAELASQAQGAVRGGSGLLISAHAQPQGQGDLLAGESEQEQVQQAMDLARSLAQSARKQQAQLPDEPEESADSAEDLQAIAALEHIGEVLKATTQSGGGQSAEAASQAEQRSGCNLIRATEGVNVIRATEGGLGTVTAYSEPHLQLSAPKGIALATPEQAVLVNGASASIVGTQDIEALAQGQFSLAAAQGLSLYTVGNAAPEGDPSQERGIKLHAADGAMKVQSQQGPSKIAAQQSVSLASTTSEAKVLGSQHLLLTAGGAYVRLEGSNIQIHAPGAVTFKAGTHDFVGAGSSQTSAALPSSTLGKCEIQKDAAANQGHGSLARSK